VTHSVCTCTLELDIIVIEILLNAICCIKELESFLSIKATACVQTAVGTVELSVIACFGLARLVREGLSGTQLANI
jgi:hypothetical protein